jgi:hypothetical protein
VARAGVKRFLLVLLIVSLVGAALVGATILLVGSAGELEARILTSVLLLGFFILTGICAAVRLERGLAWVGWIGILTSIAGLAYSELLVWEVVRTEDFDDLKPALSLGVSAAALAYASLVLLARGPYRSVNVLSWFTVAVVAAIAASLVALIVSEIEPSQNASRALGAAAILAALGTILAPLLRKFLSMGEDSLTAISPSRGRGGRHRPRPSERETEIKGV